MCWTKTRKWGMKFDNCATGIVDISSYLVVLKMMFNFYGNASKFGPLYIKGTWTYIRRILSVQTDMNKMGGGVRLKITDWIMAGHLISRSHLLWILCDK